MNISMGDICSIERSNTPQRFGGPQSDLTLFNNPGPPRADPLTGTARSRNFGSRAGADHQPCRPMRCMRTQPVTATEPVAHSGSREDPRQGRLRERVTDRLVRQAASECDPPENAVAECTNSRVAPEAANRRQR